MNWRDLQKLSAELFKSLGCYAEIDKIIEGARAKHKIDVWITFNKFGLDIKWVIECKYWNTNVPKEKVLALKGIIEDVGADRGVLISRKGFQSGAIKASQKANITLTTIEELKEIANDELVQTALHKIENKAIELKYALHELFTCQSTGPNSWVTEPLPGVDWNSVMQAQGNLVLLGFGFDRIRLKKPPYPVTFDESGKGSVVVDTVENFVELANSIIAEAENLLQEQRDKIITDLPKT